jgi:hypothetical protein
LQWYYRLNGALGQYQRGPINVNCLIGTLYLIGTLCLIGTLRGRILIGLSGALLQW